MYFHFRSGKLRNIRISPVKSGVTRGEVTDPQQRIVIRQPPQQQVIRIPASAAQDHQTLTPGSIQQINLGGKLQLVRVIGATQTVRKKPD